MWMKATPWRAGSVCLTSSAMSVTGPHTRLWQSSGVANTSTIGFLPIASRKLTSCMSSCGARVSIEAMSPFTDATVGVSIAGGLSPTAGTGSCADTFRPVPVGTSWSPCLTTPITLYLPAFGNLHGGGVDGLGGVGILLSPSR